MMTKLYWNKVRHMDTTLITYEQPLNEHIRLCLRLEQLFTALHYHLKDSSSHGSRLAVETLLKIVDVADRPDLKTKLLQTLTQQAAALSQLEQAPQVDRQKLHEILHNLDRLIDALHHNNATKMGETLRQHPFLKQIRLQLYNPAGVCNFNVPAFALWLHQPDSKRANDLNEWIQGFALLEEIISTILSLTRDSSPTQNVTANNVFYQQTMDPSLQWQMVRIIVKTEFSVYPEISVGKHRLSIRFKSLTNDPVNNWHVLEESLPFLLSCCRI